MLVSAGAIGSQVRRGVTGIEFESLLELGLSPGKIHIVRLNWIRRMCPPDS
jgi:hypothetical protein